MKTKIRFIDTAGLPPGFDCADLIAQGLSGDALMQWCRERVREGIPPPEERPAAVARAQKSPASEGSAGGADTTRTLATVGENTRKANIPVAPPPSTPTVTVSGNVAHIERPAPAAMQDADADCIPPEYSEDALADRFADNYSDSLLYVATWNRWMMWTGALWEHDETLRATDLSRRICREASNEVLQRPELAAKARNIATNLTRAGTIGNVEKLARSDRRHAATTKQWDHDDFSLNTPGGVVDLRTGDLRPARKDDYVTKTANATPGGVCLNWLQFLQVATDGDDELIAYMRRVAGYCLTGSTREQAFFFVYGTGGNGKGTFLNTLHWLLNSYSRVAATELFMEQKFAGNADSSHIAGFMGARMVMAQEVEEGKRWAENRIKSMTGGDPITAKFLYSNPFEFLPQFKLVFAGNHKPELRNVDEAIKRRLQMIPFTVTIAPEKRDVHLAARLKAESSGILQWAIDGCLDWQENGLAPPDRVLYATEEYFEEQDAMGRFMAECCDATQYERVRTSHLYQAYGRWCEMEREYVLPKRRFVQQLAGRGIKSEKMSGDMMIAGLSLKPRWRPPGAEGYNGF